jgi:hypothetical protein
LLDEKVIEAVKQRERERMSQIDAKMAKLNAREEEKQRRNQEKIARLSQWNLKEGWGLLRVLQESGLHIKYSDLPRPYPVCNVATADSDSYSIDWARLLREIGVDKAKTESGADDYYVDMINRCRRAVFMYGASSSSGTSKCPDTSANQGPAASSRGGESAEYEDPDEVNDADFAQSANSCGTPSEAVSTASDKKRDRKSKGTLIDGSNPLELPKQSFRVLQRVQAISTVRRMIFRPSLSSEQRLLIIKSAPSCGVAGWTAEHDLALLLGINRHAFEWNNIRMDPDLPFVPLDQENVLPLPEGKVALLKDYKATQRIEQLCDLFVYEPWVQTKCSALIKRPSHMARRSGGKRNRKKIHPSFPAMEGGNAQADGAEDDELDPNQESHGEHGGNSASGHAGNGERRSGDDDDDDDDGNEDEDAEEDSEEHDDDGNCDDEQGENEDDEGMDDPCGVSEGSACEDMGND